jgi:GAF domain-containing protein
VLDSAPEQLYDDLAALAAHACEAPMASLTLIDADREWSKARVVFPIQERPRTAFCAHAVLQPDIMVVRDATVDERFSGLPVVIGDPFVRFYAGVPLVSPDGFALGVLCVLDTEPRDLSDRQADALRALGRQAVALLELRRAAATEARRVAALHAVQQMATRILARTDMADVLRGIARGIATFTGSKRAVILDFDPDAGVLEGMAGHGIDLDETGRDIRIPLDECPSAERAIITGQIQFADGLIEPNTTIAALIGTSSHVCVPLRADETVFGVVFLDRPTGSGRPTREQEETSLSFAMLAMGALDRTHEAVHHRPAERAAELASVDGEPTVKLSDQELAIIRLAAEGMTNPEIGERLFLSRHTVKEYFGNAMRKLGVSTRVEAVLRATRLGLLEPV